MIELNELLNQMRKIKRDFDEKYEAPPKVVKMTADEFELLKKFATIRVNYNGDPVNSFSGVRIIIKKDHDLKKSFTADGQTRVEGGTS